MVESRKNGKRKSNYDDESTVKVLKTAKPFVRADWGGKDKIEQVKKKMAERGIECGDKSAIAILDIIAEQLNGVRNRLYPRIDEVINRLSEDTNDEVLP